MVVRLDRLKLSAGMASKVSVLSPQLKRVGLALLPLGVFVTGALAFDRLAKPGTPAQPAAVAQGPVVATSVVAVAEATTAVPTRALPSSTSRSAVVPAPALAPVMRDDRSLVDLPRQAPAGAGAVVSRPDVTAPQAKAPAVVTLPAVAVPERRLMVGSSRLVATSAETPLSIKIEGRASVPTGSYVLLSGLPQSASLSHGVGIGPGTWLVDAGDVDGLRLKIRAVERTQFALGLRWVTVDGHLLAQDNLAVEALPSPTFEGSALSSVTSVAVRPAIESSGLSRLDEPTQPVIGARTGGSKATAGAPSSGGKPAELARSKQPNEGAATGSVGGKTIDAPAFDSLLTRGRKMLEIGNYAVGRPLLERAAANGSAEAAMMIAKSFDPNWLAGNGSVGATANLAKARTWYEEARRLGASDAVQYLTALTRN